MLILIVGAAVARGHRRRRRDWSALGRAGRPPGDGAWAWLAAMAILVLAMAGPRWGRRADSTPPGHDVVLLIDVSRSMAAEDAVPNRLGVAKEAAEGLVRAVGREPGGRVAVVAFAGRGVLRCALTENLGAVIDTIKNLRPGGVRPGGTDLGAALDAALDAFEPEERSEGRTIVLFSDGEDHGASWSGLIPRLLQERAIVHAVAIGDSERGHPVPTGGGKPLIHEDKVVQSRRSDTAFEAFSGATGGAVVRLGLAAADLGTLYQTRIAPVARRRRESISPPDRVERYPLFVAAALVIGLAGSRPRRFGSFAVLLLLGVPLAAGAGRDEMDTAAGAVRRGQSLYASGDLPKALAAFRHAAVLEPRSPLPLYNEAATLFRMGRFAEAGRLYRAARAGAEGGLRMKIDYALGNVAVALGDFPAAISHYDACLTAPVSGPPYETVRRDAAINRRFAERQPPPPPPEEGPGDRRTPRRQSGGGGNDPGSPKEPNPDNSARNPAEGATPPPGAAPGGPGAADSASAKEDSPTGRLERALARAREARKHRLDDERDDGDSAEPDRKDW